MSEDAAIIELPPGAPGAVLGASRTLTQVGSAFSSVGDAVAAGRGSVGSWQGASSDGFRALADEYQASAAQLVTVTADAALAVRRYAEDLQEAREAVRRLREQEEDCVGRIATWKERLADAERRAAAARSELSASFAVGLTADAFSLSRQAAAQSALDQALGDASIAQQRLTEERDELQRLRDAATRWHERARQAESAAAGQVSGLAGGLPGVATMPGAPGLPATGAVVPISMSPFAPAFGGPSSNQRAWEAASARAREALRRRDDLIDGGHHLPPGDLTAEEAARFLDAYAREHPGALTGSDRLVLGRMLMQGERPPDLPASIYETPPAFFRVTGELMGVPEAERAIDAVGDGDLGEAALYGAMAFPGGKGLKGGKEILEESSERLAREADDPAKRAVRQEEGADSVADELPRTDPLETARSGGRHSGWMEQYATKTDRELEKGIRSLEKQIAEHETKIQDPVSAVSNWENLHPARQEALVNRKWPGDIARQREQKAILEGLLKERQP